MYILATQAQAVVQDAGTGLPGPVSPIPERDNTILGATSEDMQETEQVRSIRMLHLC